MYRMPSAAGTVDEAYYARLQSDASLTAKPVKVTTSQAKLGDH